MMTRESTKRKSTRYMKTDGYGQLHIVATPIGNLADITFRAVKALREADLIAAEDTRHSRILLEKYEIKTPVTSYHEHNKYDKAYILAEKLKEGKNIALITDAGTPAISDPGQVLVDICKKEGILVTSEPGPCALVTALSISGMPSGRFCFEGFLPADRQAREKILASLEKEERTIILYEAPHHLKKTVSQLAERLGDRRMCVCRELTKTFEEAWQTSLYDAVKYYETNEPRGEYVLIIEGIDEAEIFAGEKEKWSKMTPQEHLKFYTDKGIDKKEAMKKMAADLGCSKRDVYRSLL